MALTIRLTVHRATDQIGGNCVEIATDSGARIVLDVGRPLDAPSSATGLLPRTLDLAAPIDGVLISHPHQDHYGLLEEVPPEWPVFCGEATAHLIRLTSGIFGKPMMREFRPWKSGQKFRAGPFDVTSYLTDHSAFDAHMLLIEVEGKRILYSGDFRMHGRKSRLVARMMASPPERLDALLMEGTNLGSEKPCVTENDLESDFVRLFNDTKGRVFVAWSAQNIDRTVTIYRACLRAKRTLAVDLYTAEVLEKLASFGKIPQPGWPGLVVVVTSTFARMYRKKGYGSFLDKMARHGISTRKLAAHPGKWVAMVRPSLIADYERGGVTPTKDDAWSWSQWRGYLKNDDGVRLHDWFRRGGAKPVHVHTSGHASPTDLRAFAQAMKPSFLVPIHGVAWDEDNKGFPPIRRLVDGEPLAV